MRGPSDVCWSFIFQAMDAAVRQGFLVGSWTWPNEGPGVAKYLHGSWCISLGDSLRIGPSIRPFSIPAADARYFKSNSLQV